VKGLRILEDFQDFWIFENISQNFTEFLNIENFYGISGCFFEILGFYRTFGEILGFLRIFLILFGVVGKIC
jgi:hypothetical protein